MYSGEGRVLEGGLTAGLLPGRFTEVECDEAVPEERDWGNFAVIRASGIPDGGRSEMLFSVDPALLVPVDTLIAEVFMSASFDAAILGPVGIGIKLAEALFSTLVIRGPVGIETSEPTFSSNFGADTVPK
jgi:hypothetical protein